MIAVVCINNIDFHCSSHNDDASGLIAVARLPQGNRPSTALRPYCGQKAVGEMLLSPQTSAAPMARPPP
jgi:hypothetical protein